MGWTFFQDNPAETRESIIRREFQSTATTDNPFSWGFDSMAVRGSTVYAIMYREHAHTMTRDYFGTVILTQRKRGEFGYKDISEDCGPYYYEAPVGMIKRLDQIAPVDPASNAAGWRARCRAAHADKKRRAKIQWAPGMRVQFTPTGRVFEILADAGPRRGFFVRVADRSDLQQYRATARSFAHAVIVAEPEPMATDETRANGPHYLKVTK
jgi:hypothetical protein